MYSNHVNACLQYHQENNINIAYLYGKLNIVFIAWDGRQLV